MKARIPTRQDYNNIVKLKDLHGKWKALKNGATRGAKRLHLWTAWMICLTSHMPIQWNFLNIEDDRKFLEAQREKGRRGCMGAQWTQSYHRASWMAKLINCLKIYLYQSQFRLILWELSGLWQFNVFVIKVNWKAWFVCPSALSTPPQDLELLQQLVQYKATNEAVANAALNNFLRHHSVVPQWNHDRFGFLWWQCRANGCCIVTGVQRWAIQTHSNGT